MKDKCIGCFAHQYDEEFGDICHAPACEEDWDYDPETRSYIEKKLSFKERLKKHKWLIIAILIRVVVFTAFGVMVVFRLCS